MDFMTEFSSLSGLDGLAVTVLIVVWLGLSWWIEHPSSKRPSVTVVMSEYRRKWMQVMIHRDPRIFDSQIMASLRQRHIIFCFDLSFGCWWCSGANWQCGPLAWRG